jgi:hypothetical protein
MSLKNFKKNSFEYEQPLTFSSLNDLSYNDILLKNYLEPRPRGVLDYTQTVSYDITKNFFLAPTGVSDDNPTIAYKRVEVPSEIGWIPMSIKFFCEASRLTKLTFTSSAFYASDIVSAGVVRFAFLISTNKGDIQLLNSSYKTSYFKNAGIQPTVCMNHISVLSPGEHEIFVGVKPFRCIARIGEANSANRLLRPTQLFAEDLGFAVQVSEDDDFEFQE